VVELHTLYLGTVLPFLESESTMTCKNDATMRSRDQVYGRGKPVGSGETAGAKFATVLVWGKNWVSSMELDPQKINQEENMVVKHMRRSGLWVSS
jgi:hypothetical protein